MERDRSVIFTLLTLTFCINAVKLRVHRNVVARRGSKVSLICNGSDVYELDTSIVWKFNNKTVKESSNRRINEKWLPESEGRFSLNILNVSEKDVGEYQCIAEVDDFESESGVLKTESSLIQLQLFQSTTTSPPTDEITTKPTIPKTSPPTNKITSKPTTPKTSPPTNKITTKPTIQPPRLSPTLKDNIGETEVTVEFVNKKNLSNGNPVRYFQMIVIPLTKRKDLGSPADAKYKTIKRKYENQVKDEPYMTAEFSKDESRTQFTVGDGKYYSRSGITEGSRKRRDTSTVAKYLNGKLESDTQYAVFQRSFDKDGGYENEGFIEFTTKAKSSTTIIVSVVVVVVVLLIILGVGFIVWRRNRQNEPKMTSRSQRFSTQEIMEMSAINDPSTDPRRISASHQSNDHIPAAEGQNDAWPLLQ